MSVRIMVGDVRARLADLQDESVHCVVTSNGGRFKPGVHAWRSPQPHWQKDWLAREYAELKRSTGEIAAEIGCTDANVLFWLKKHGIPRRSLSEARALKKWGASGAGTTGLVADRLGRDAVLIELNPEYAGIAERRIYADGGMFAKVAAE